ncbi:MAG: hypothetical protein ACOCXJ_03930 [Planctomycetota bacterium]
MHILRLASPLVLAVAALLLVACGGSRDAGGAPSGTSTQDGKIDGVEVPEWVVDPSAGGVFGAVGSSRPLLGGFNATMNKAKAEGRKELARIISTKVQAAYVTYFQEGGEVFQGTDGPELQTMATEMAEDTARLVTDQILQGSKRKAFWQHPENKELFVWMVVTDDHREILERQIKNAARQQIVRRSNVAAELKTKEALDRLDAAIDQELERTGQM